MGHRQWCLTQGFGRLYVAGTESTIWLTNFAITHLQCLHCRVRWRPSGTSLGARHMGNKSKLFRRYPAFTGSFCPVKYGRPCVWLACSLAWFWPMVTGAVGKRHCVRLPQQFSSRSPHVYPRTCHTYAKFHDSVLFHWAAISPAWYFKHCDWRGEQLHLQTTCASWPNACVNESVCDSIDCGDISDSKGEWRQFCHGMTESSYLST